MALCYLCRCLLTLPLLNRCLEVVFRLTFLSYWYKGDQFAPVRRVRRELVAPGAQLGVRDARACSALILR